MAYNKRNDGEGRVVGFKDGQPVYKKVNRGADNERKQFGRSNGERKPYKPDGERRPYRPDGERRPYKPDGERWQNGGSGGERRYNDRDRDGRYDGSDDYTGKRSYNTYNRKDEPQSGYDKPRYEHGDRSGNRPGYRDHGGYNERTGYREHAKHGFERPRTKDDGSRFGNEDIQRKADDMRNIRPPREIKRYDNLKPLPQDIPEVREEDLPNIIMGRNPVKEAIKTGRSIDRILVTSEHDGSLNEILDLAYDAKLVVRNVERAKLDEICMPFGHNGKPGNHQGIVAYVPEAEYCELSDILDYAKEKGEQPFVVLLDGIEDPHNLGSIIRSAECAGAHGIVIPKRRSASVTATVVKTSAGATEHMKIAKVVNLPVAIERLKEAGCWVAGADMGGEPMYNADLKGPFALVVGAEGAGISRLVKEKCDYIVSVPLKGHMESLNASVAAAVIMFEKVRQEQQ